MYCDNVIEPNKEWQQESSYSKVQVYKSEWCFQHRRQTHKRIVLHTKYIQFLPFARWDVHIVHGAQTINKKFCRYHCYSLISVAHTMGRVLPQPQRLPFWGAELYSRKQRDSGELLKIDFFSIFEALESEICLKIRRIQKKNWLNFTMQWCNR